ncbi:unnamed protein product [Amoebophrya sp. A25]|nr:unnamed protein product [Amoebophrya sp. A25]|eukprot:GSA25T00008093001.1
MGEAMSLRPVSLVALVGITTGVFVVIVEQTLHIGGVNLVHGQNVDDLYFIYVLQGFYVFAMTICLIDLYTHKILLKEEAHPIASSNLQASAARIVNIVYALGLIFFLVLPPAFALGIEFFSRVTDDLPVGTFLSVVPPTCLLLLFFLDYDRFCRRMGSTVFLPALILAYDGKLASTAAGKLRAPGTIALLQFYLMSIYLHKTLSRRRTLDVNRNATSRSYIRLIVELLALFLLFLSPLAVMSLSGEIQLLTLNGPWYAFLPIYASLLLLTVCHHILPVWTDLLSGSSAPAESPSTPQQHPFKSDLTLLENAFHFLLLFYVFSHAWWGLAYRDWLLGLPQVPMLVLGLALLHGVALGLFGKNAPLVRNSVTAEETTLLGKLLLGEDGK